MGKALEDFRHDLATVRTGRASASLLENIKIEYYGTATPLNQVATLGVPEPNLLTVQPWDPGLVTVIEKAIRSSDLGMSPNNDGKIIRLNVPAMSGDQRTKMASRIKKSAEDAKVACRNIRRDSNKNFDAAEKAKEMTEDDRDKGKEDVQSLLKQYEDKITEQADKKSKEIMEQ